MEGPFAFFNDLDPILGGFFFWGGINTKYIFMEMCVPDVGYREM